MTVLGIETTTMVCGVAICQDGKIVATFELEERSVHSEKLLSLVHEAITHSPFRLTGIDGIAVSIGPGSFTGLRIGLSVAKGLVYATGKTLLAVPTLEALAYRVVMHKEIGGGMDVLAALDARRDEVYCQMFRSSGAGLSSEGVPRAMHVAEVVGEIGVRPVMVIGDGSVKLLRAAQALGQDAMWKAVPDDINKCTSSSVAILGEQMLRRGERVDPITVEPYYVKEFFEAR